MTAADLAAIRARRSACLGTGRAKDIEASLADIPALLAEVERLKELVEAAYREGWEDGKTFDIFAWDDSNAKRLLDGGAE